MSDQVGPGAGHDSDPGPDQRTGALAAPARIPTQRAVGWSMLGGAVRYRALRILVDEHGLDGYAAAGAIGHALRSDESPWAADVDAAISRALAEVFRETFRVVAEALRPIVEGYAAAAPVAGPSARADGAGRAAAPHPVIGAGPRASVGSGFHLGEHVGGL